MQKYELICCVVNDGAAPKTLKIAKKYGIKGGTISKGRGTVSNRLLDILGIHDIRREIVAMVVEGDLGSAAIAGICREMEFDKPHHGIAFSIEVSEFIGSKNIIQNNPKIIEVEKNMYNIIYAVVGKGDAESVIEAAKEAGARGGTIVNARGAGIHEVQKLFSVEIEPEREEVFIIAESAAKDAIVDSIKDHLKIDEPGNGILFVMDVKEVYGLH